MMSHTDFQTAKNFIFADIQRELDMANSDVGSGNFLVALGLLCYTEFAGSLIPSVGSGSRTKFDTFFDRLGEGYRSLRGSHNVYNIFRCGLAHEYFVKKNCTVSVTATPNGSPGVGLQSNGSYYFANSNYFNDFKKAFEDLERELYPASM